MTTLREAATQALEAMEALHGGCTDSDDGTVEAITVWCPEIIDALKAALAEPVQEPVAKCIDDICSEHLGQVEAFDHLPRGTLLYTAPPQRKETNNE